MNNVLKTTLIVFGALVLAGGLFLGGMFFGNFRTFGPWGMMQNYIPGQNYGSENYPGPGMMGGRGRGYGMMQGYTGNNVGVAPLSVADAKKAAQTYLDALKITDLSISEVMVFDNNAYVVVKEASTGMGAFELLVDPLSKVAYPEMGPNMMWNLKYAGLNHGGMMGRGRGMRLAPGASAGVGTWNGQGGVPADVSADMPISQEQAIKNAQAYLDQALPGATAANDPVKFYGYYTLDFEKDGKVVGMLSVNGFDGQVFLHTWHGTFIEEAKIE